MAWVLTTTLSVGAWALLVAWEASPLGRFLDHHGGGTTLPGPAALGVFVAAWAIMLTAMMLPTTAGLVAPFASMVAARPDRRRLLAALVAGYMAIWIAAGVVAYLGDEALQTLDDRWSIIGDRGWLLGVGALLVAGGYQFSALKVSCLTRCRTPYGLLLSRWRGRAPLAEAYRIGVEHGRTCIGCCWALMLVMFAVGANSLGWMLALAAVMTVEKTARVGRSLTRPLGAALVAVALGLALVNVTSRDPLGDEHAPHHDHHGTDAAAGE